MYHISCKTNCDICNQLNIIDIDNLDLKSIYEGHREPNSVVSYFKLYEESFKTNGDDLFRIGSEKNEYYNIPVLTLEIIIRCIGKIGNHTIHRKIPVTDLFYEILYNKDTNYIIHKKNKCTLRIYKDNEK